MGSELLKSAVGMTFGLVAGLLVFQLTNNAPIGIGVALVVGRAAARMGY